jgi:hypothetical protein
MMNELRTTNPELAGVVNDPAGFRTAFEALERQQAEAEMQKQREIVWTTARGDRLS